MLLYPCCILPNSFSCYHQARVLLITCLLCLFKPQLRLPRLPWWLSGKETTNQRRRRKRCRLNPWVRKFPWRSQQQPTPVFLPGKSHGQRSLVGYDPWGHRGVKSDRVTKQGTRPMLCDNFLPHGFWVAFQFQNSIHIVLDISGSLSYCHKYYRFITFL